MKLTSKFFLTFSLVVLCMGPVLADGESDETDAKMEQLKREQTRDILDHLETKQEPGTRYEPIKLEAGKTIKYRIKLEHQDNDAGKCHADVAIGYLQFDTQARVDATIENHDCAASDGQYEVELQIVDKNGGIQSLEHTETWTRDNDTPIKSRKFYDIGKNVELMRTIVRGVTCSCTPADAE